MGPGKLKSKPNLMSMSDSNCTRSYLVMFFFSPSVSKLIILEKDGCIGCSSLAAKRIEIVASCMSFYSGKFQWPSTVKYRSKMAAAQKSVSIL